MDGQWTGWGSLSRCRSFLTRTWGGGVLSAQACLREGFGGRITSPEDQPTQSKVGGGSLGQTASAQPLMCSPVCSPPAFTESMGSDVSFLTMWGLVDALT